MANENLLLKQYSMTICCSGYTLFPPNIKILLSGMSLQKCKYLLKGMRLLHSFHQLLLLVSHLSDEKQIPVLTTYVECVFKMSLKKINMKRKKYVCG